MKKVMSLVLIADGEKVLLGMKKRGFGTGRWNGFGGKVDGGESIEKAATREVFEECGLTVSNLEHRGVLDFSFEGKSGILEVHIFKVTQFTGEPKETEEMKPQWFSYREIPYASMWKDDKHWLPMFLAGKKFRGNFHFGGPDDDILTSSLTEVSSL